MALTRDQALDIASRHHIPLGEDFCTLRASQVENIIAAADEAKYRKPASANGSRARYFHARLVRAANRRDAD